jgi:hypothetical protein
MPVSPGFARLARFAAMLGALLLPGTLSAQTTQAPAAEKAKPAPLPTPTPLATGRAVDQAGAPIPRARGVVFGASVLAPMSSEFEADVDGRFTLRELPKSAFNLALFPRELGAKAPAPRLLKDRAAWDGAPIQMGTGVAVRALLIDQDGQPVPGTVRFLSIGDVDLPDLAGVREIWARADPEGRISFNSPAGLHKFVAEGPEHIPVSFERRVSAAAPKAISAENPALDFGTFTLKRGLTLRGRVENDLGEPLKDVALTTYTNPRSPQVETFKARSKDGGRFELLGFVEGSVFLWPKLPGHYLEYAELQAGDQDAVIVMARTGAIAGRVLDDRGEPVAGASLNFRGSGKLAGRGLGSKKFNTAEFMFDELPPVAAHLQVTLPGFRSKTLENVSVASGQTTEVGDITLDRGRTVTGQIVNSKDAGVPGATLNAGLSGTYERSHLTADANGEFRFSGLPSGIIEFETTAPGYSPKRQRIEIAAEEDPEPVRIVLENGGRILGSVLTRRGSPVSGALMRVVSKDATAWSKQETTNASGGFEIKDLPTSVVQLSVLAASSNGMNMLSSYSSVASREIAIQSGGVTRADFVLREIEVTGRVSGTSPIEGLRVQFSTRGGGTISFGDGRTGGVIPTASGAPRFSSTTDAAGAYRLVVDEPGRYDVAVISLLPRRTTLLRQTIDIPDLPPDIHEFAADLKITNARLVGIVVDKETNRPIPRAHLQLGTGLTALPMLAQTDGRFEVFVPPGLLDIAVTAGGYKPRDLQVTVAEKTADQKIELTRLNPGAETVLAGVARLESGQPAGLAMVRAHPLDGETKSFLTTQADAAGRFFWPDASPGRYAVWASLVGRAGHATGETGKEPVEIKLQPTVPITYVVVDEAGVEIKGAWLEALSVNGVPFWGVLRSGQGFLPPGRVVLRADSETYAVATTVDVRSGETMTVTVQATLKKKN